MAFMKTNAAIATRNLSREDARTLAAEDEFPTDPEKGDAYKGFIWDGGAWVTLEAWAARQTSDEGEA